MIRAHFRRYSTLPVFFSMLLWYLPRGVLGGKLGKATGCVAGSVRNGIAHFCESALSHC